MRQLDQRLQRDFDTYGKRGFHRLLEELLPHKMIDPFVEMSGIPPANSGIRLLLSNGSAWQVC